MPLRYLEDQKPLDEYLEAKAEIQRLEERIDELKPLILTAVMEEPDGIGEHLGCRLRYYYRKQYEYTEKVEEMRKQLKAAEQYERSSGLAVEIGAKAILVVEHAQRF